MLWKVNKLACCKQMQVEDKHLRICFLYKIALEFGHKIVILYWNKFGNSQDLFFVVKTEVKMIPLIVVFVNPSV
ncbi:hypothetical protein DOY81_000337, partial [Sarcophaga bullata]